MTGIAPSVFGERRESRNIDRTIGFAFEAVRSGCLREDCVMDAGDLETLQNELEGLRKQNAQLLRADARTRKLTQAIRDREALYRRAIASADGVVYQLDFHKNVYAYMGEGILGLIGYTPEETTPDLWIHIGNQYERRGELAGMTASEAIRKFRSGEIAVWTADYQCRKKTGETCWLNDSSVLVRDRRGRITGCLGILQDITSRKLVEMELRESEGRYRNLLETIQLIAVGLDIHGNVTFANSYLLTLTGYTEEEILGRNWFDLCIPADEREEVQAGYSEKIGNGSIAAQDENHVITRNGARRLISWNNTVLKDSQSRVQGTASIGVDITERKQLEMQLLQAQKMESIGRLAGGVAHDFNNVLTAIIGFTELAIEDMEAGSETYGYLENVQIAAQRAADLTAQLLAFARKQPIAPRVIQINNVLMDSDKILRRIIGEHIELVTLPSDDLGLVSIDPGQLQQILINLVVNARDAMPSGGTITIETANAHLDSSYTQRRMGVVSGEYVMIAVTDTGFGMTPEVQAHIFEPFYSTKEVGQGTGLGLATCYGVVNQNRGDIWIFSEPDHGTTLKIFLPRVWDELTEPPEREIPPTLQGTETILLVEDEPQVRAVAAQTLRPLGYVVVEARNGVEALSIAEGHSGRFDLLITDVVMPKMGGAEVAQRLKASFPDLKMLFVSGYTGSTIASFGLSEPGVSFLQKPFTGAALARRVREILDLTETP